MKKALILLAYAGVAASLGTACSKDKTTSNPPFTVNCSTVTNKAFAADVSPIIQSSCAISGCHASGSTNGPGELTNYLQISSAASNIRSAVSTGRMPQTGTLSSAQKSSIICWIDSGAPNN